MSYFDYVTSKHKDKPKFKQVIELTADSYLDVQTLGQYLLTQSHHIDTANGKELDIIGEWVGLSRKLNVNIDYTYFSWGIEGVGWGQANWKGEFSPDNTITELDDETYRVVLKLKIVSNRWSGSLDEAVTAINTVISPYGAQAAIIDNQDMTQTLLFALGSLPNVLKELIIQDVIPLRSMGVGIKIYAFSSAKLFGWGIQNSMMGGWSEGNWGQVYDGN